mgnify:FL=1
MIYFLVILFFFANQQCAELFQIVWDNNIDFDSIEDEELSRSGQVRMPNWFLIFPGNIL